MMEHAPILIIVLPLLTAFLIPLLDMINAKLRNAGVIIGSFVTILMVFLTSVQLYKGD
ncbi:MAG: Na+/H+ antiporter subunit D, partial [Methanosarcinales archaeon]|nr:Na+/H+ antiporter subunit D [Methanosarcinales archaeon]